MAWFKRSKKPKPVAAVRQRSQVPEGLWVKCDGCREIIYSKELHKNLMICPKCGYYMYMWQRDSRDLASPVCSLKGACMHACMHGRKIAAKWPLNGG